MAIFVKIVFFYYYDNIILVISNSYIILEKNKESKNGSIIKRHKNDVLNYCILMADACGLDMDEIIQDKIKRNNEKYPVEKAKNSAKKYNEL